MKRIELKLTLALIFSVMTLGLSAQSYLEDPKYGDTPEEREKNVLVLNFFKDTYENKDYNAAVPYLQTLLAKAPKSTVNLYIRGAVIYRNKILAATSLPEKNQMIDSLMLIYDLRSKYFGDDAEQGTPYIMALKAREYISFKPADREGIVKLCQAAIAAGDGDSDPEFLNIYFNELVQDYKNDNIEADFLIDEYERLTKIFDANPTPGKAEAKKTFDALFLSSGAASCENVEKLFRPRIAANPKDTVALGKALALLSHGNCNGDFMLEVGEKYYVVKPSSQTALALANEFEKRKEYAKALKYLNEAIANESDPKLKSDLCVRIAASELGSNNARNAANFARQAVDINPENGFGYMLLAQAYSVGSSGCSGFERQSVYWLCYDLLSKAKSLLPEDQQRGVDTQLAGYRANFPSKEECFFRGLNEGAGYNVNCGWVSGRTSVREGR